MVELCRRRRRGWCAPAAFALLVTSALALAFVVATVPAAFAFALLLRTWKRALKRQVIHAATVVTRLLLAVRRVASSALEMGGGDWKPLN